MIPINPPPLTSVTHDHPTAMTETSVPAQIFDTHVRKQDPRPSPSLVGRAKADDHPLPNQHHFSLTQLKNYNIIQDPQITQIVTQHLAEKKRSSWLSWIFPPTISRTALDALTKAYDAVPEKIRTEMSDHLVNLPNGNIKLTTHLLEKLKDVDRPSIGKEFLLLAKGLPLEKESTITTILAAFESSTLSPEKGTLAANFYNKLCHGNPSVFLKTALTENLPTITATANLSTPDKMAKILEKSNKGVAQTSPKAIMQLYKDIDGALTQGHHCVIFNGAIFRLEDGHQYPPLPLHAKTIETKELLTLYNYMNAHKEKHCADAKAKGQDLYIPTRSSPFLPRALHFTQDGHAIVHFTKRRSRGDHLLGKGGFKTVVVAYDLEKAIPYASISINGNIAGSTTMKTELKYLEKFHGTQGFIQKHADLTYISQKHDKSKQRILLDYCDADLLAYQEKEIPTKHKISIATQLIHACATMHEKGVLHRDIKPDNILLKTTTDGSPPEVFICDFGLACDIGDEKERISVVGTPNYWPAAYKQAYRQADDLSRQVAAFKQDTRMSPAAKNKERARLAKALHLHQESVSKMTQESLDAWALGETLAQALKVKTTTPNEESRALIQSALQNEKMSNNKLTIVDLISAMLDEDPAYRLTPIQAKKLLSANIDWEKSWWTQKMGLA